MRKFFAILVVSMSSATGASCKDSTESAPPQVAGNWNGSLRTNQSATQGTWVMTLSQTGSQLTGSFSCSLAGGSSGPIGLNGTVDGSNHVSLSFAHFCQTSLDADVSGKSLSGTWVTGGGCACPGSAGQGTWQGTRP
jgi:hypothetical protein